MPDRWHSTNSDPTYEAWKRACGDFEKIHNYQFRSYLRGMETILNPVVEGIKHLHSDPTYEAWKLEELEGLCWTVCHSDPTYEAWKLLRGLVASP